MLCHTLGYNLTFALTHHAFYTSSPPLLALPAPLALCPSEGGRQRVQRGRGREGVSGRARESEREQRAERERERESRERERGTTIEREMNEQGGNGERVSERADRTSVRTSEHE